MMKYIITVVLAALLLPLSAYAEITTATYYARMFNGRRMANGKIYLPTKMVAASNKYRLGTKVKITNRRNGKSVIVTVSDRCKPGVCTIDLSPRAFKKIGRLRQGRLPVRVSRIRG